MKNKTANFETQTQALNNANKQEEVVTTHTGKTITQPSPNPFLKGK